MRKMVMCFAVLAMLLVNASFAEGKNAGDDVLVLPYCAEGTTISIDIGDADYIVTNDGKIIKVGDLLSFSTKQEALQYIDGLRYAIENPVVNDAMINYAARATHGDALVSSITYNYLNTLALRVEYTTSGDGNTGRITYHKAYTTFTGFTLGIAWNEITCNSQIASSGKDIYASANGELAYYILVENLLEVGREAVSLSGYCYAVR